MEKVIAFPFPLLKPEFADGKKLTITDYGQTYSEYKLCVNEAGLSSWT